MKRFCCDPKVIIGALMLVLGLVFLTPLKGTLLPYLPLLVVLICPLSMFSMMFIMKNKDNGYATTDNKILFTCPECGLSYKDKTWADKCERWCKENHSCNLEITKHAVKLIDKKI